MTTYKGMKHDTDNKISKEEQIVLAKIQLIIKKMGGYGYIHLRRLSRHLPLLVQRIPFSELKRCVNFFMTGLH